MDWQRSSAISMGKIPSKRERSFCFAESVPIGARAVSYTHLFYRFMMAYAPNSATIIHINGFIRGLSNLSVLGSGLGKAGTITGATTGTAKSLLAAESYIGVLIIQVGLVGFAFFAYSWFEVFRVMFKTMKIKKNSIVASICVELISVMIESLFSESAITIVGTGLTFILAGYV